MKILQFGLTGNHGGVESFVFNYAQKLEAEGITFDYVDLQGKGLAKAEQIVKKGNRIYTLKDARKYPFLAAKRIRDIIREGEYSCVHVNMLSAASPVPVIASLQAGAKVIMHSHNTQTVGFVRKILHSLNSVFLRELPLVRVACGEEAGRWMFGKKPFLVIPNAVDVDSFCFDSRARQKLRQDLQLKEDTLLLGFVGRLSAQKNPVYLAKILCAVKKQALTDVKLVIVGDGELQGSVLVAAAELGVEADVLCVGKQDNTPAWYSAMDALLLPSLWEGLPLVGVEAQTSGLPCFFSDCVTEEVKLTELVHFCPLTETAENWANVIVQNLNQGTDRRVFAKRIAKTNFSIHRSAELLRDLYIACQEQE